MRLKAKRQWLHYAKLAAPVLPAVAAIVLQYSLTLPSFWLGVVIPLLVWLTLSLMPPSWASIPMLALGGLFMWAVFHINEMKISAVRMPVTALDIEQIFTSPALLWRLIGLPDSTGLPVLILVALIVAGLLLWKIFELRSARLIHAVIYVAVVLMAAQAMRTFVQMSEASVTSQIQERNDIWSNDGVTKLYESIGPVPFLLYSMMLNKSFPAIIMDEGIADAPASAAAIEAATRQTMTFRKGPLPNIVVMHLESLFNPDWAFKLNKELNAGLFRRTKVTKLLAPMRVNIVGGGSWVTEFEILTGLDARLFGYWGFYTHPNVSPMLTGGFPSYLKGKGYKTTAFYTTDGAFLNVQNAFNTYGIDSFKTPEDIGIKNGWFAKDSTTARAYANARSDNPDQPFFDFVSTNGAHSPYRCKHFRPGDEFDVHFLSADFYKNCILNEFILHLRDSRDAATAIITKLREIEARTGRPFVFVMYGDHQPHAFTGTDGHDGVDYSGERTGRPIKETFVHIFSSTAGEFADFSAPVPTALLPTLISGFVAETIEDSYLPVNLHLYSKCGADLFADLQGPTTLGTTAAKAGTSNAAVSEACRTAQYEAISTYRASGLLKK